MSGQLSLFSDAVQADAVSIEQLDEIRLIEGLRYIPAYVSEPVAQQLWSTIDKGPWLTDLKRRVQHYGYRYDYKARRIDHSMHIGDLPTWSKSLALKLHKDGFFRVVPDQLIINEYQPSQGITDHVDCEPCFDDTIVSLSLGSQCIMNLINRRTNKRIPLLLEPRSIVVLKGASRYDWMHGIPHRKTDTFKEVKYPRTRRISLTYRKVILETSDPAGCHYGS